MGGTTGFPISSFIGGADLVENGQGLCTACHAGENPFVIHPDDEPFSKIVGDTKFDRMPDNWHKPIVHADWPNNPGPLTEILDTPPNGEGNCSDCHTQTYAGRFPLLYVLYRPAAD